jgi:CRP-like cAMP-binding protein
MLAGSTRFEEALMADGNRELVDRLAEVPILAGAPERTRRKVASQMKEFKFPAGTTIVEESAEDAKLGRLYLLLSGEAEVVVKGESIRQLGPGDHFGELALLDGGPRSASVVALSDVQAVGLAGWNFRPLLLEEPELALAVIDTLAQRLRQANVGLTANS